MLVTRRCCNIPSDTEHFGSSKNINELMLYNRNRISSTSTTLRNTVETYQLRNATDRDIGQHLHLSVVLLLIIVENNINILWMRHNLLYNLFETPHNTSCPYFV